jgi:alpha-L-rhamnosidase
LIDTPPFEHRDKFWDRRGRWPAQWITHPDHDQTRASIHLYRLQFQSEVDQKIRIHVSADEQYHLRLNNAWIGNGPENGDRLNWFFDTYDLDVKAGANLFVVRCHRLADHSQVSQVSVKPAFILAPDDADRVDALATGIAAWEVTDLTAAHTLIPPRMLFYSGSRVEVDTTYMPGDWRQGEAAPQSFLSPATLGYGYNDRQQTDQPNQWILRPGMVPQAKRTRRSFGKIKYIGEETTFERLIAENDSASHLPVEGALWQQKIDAGLPITIPPNTSRRVVFDLGDYVCGYINAIVDHGAGARLSFHWAESCYEPPQRQPNDLMDWGAFST